MQLPSPPWYRRWSVILAGVIGMAAIAALLGWRGLQQVASPETTVATRPAATTAPPPTTTPTTAPRGEPTTTRPPPGVLWQERGSDVGKSPGFRAPAAWRIEWSFDCGNFRQHGGGNFKITGDGAFDRVEIQRFGVQRSGSRAVSGGGFGHLFVDSVCQRWTVRALAR